MDSRNLDQLRATYNGIICGFCLPYLSKADGSKLIRDAKELLSEKGMLYLSFVEGAYENSGYQSGSSGDKTYFYYHNLNEISADLIQNGFEVTHLNHKHYDKKDGTKETHTILLATKIMK